MDKTSHQKIGNERTEEAIAAVRAMRSTIAAKRVELAEIRERFKRSMEAKDARLFQQGKNGAGASEPGQGARGGQADRRARKRQNDE